MVKFSLASYYSLTHHRLIAMFLVCNLGSVYNSLFLLSCLILFYCWYRGIKRATKLDLNISLISRFIREICCHPNTINVQLRINGIIIQKRIFCIKSSKVVKEYYYYFYSLFLLWHSIVF